MTERSTTVTVEAAVVSDRGLNERRPLNEDSYLVKPEYGIFAVADGVGGAEAGEVASQTAVEVLEKAFKHQRDGDDVEDLLEIAIQRANASIFRMSRESPRFAMMATTVVALHLDGLRATVGHVGDSRLYLVGPDGRARRGTEDHSVVEEEVRAGRMTPEQAQNHPSRNVISRALGAEQDVEVDLSSFEVEPGTTFLICTDGITRHIPDNELGSIIAGADDLQAACEEMKRRCFERGAEDNLTAVLVRVGGRVARQIEDDSDLERTISIEKETLGVASSVATPASAPPSSPSHIVRPFDTAGRRTDGANGVAAESHAAGQTSSNPQAPASHQMTARKTRGGFARFVAFLFVVTLFSAAAFYGGMIFEQRRQTDAEMLAAPAPGPPAPSDGALALGSFELERNRVDSSPVTELTRMESELAAVPSHGDDPRFLYLYGRALMLNGRNEDALANFEKAVSKIQESPTSTNARLIIDARLAAAAAALRMGDATRARTAVDALGKTFDNAAPAPSPSLEASPSASPQF